MNTAVATSSAATLTFTAANYGTDQNLVISAPSDVDAAAGATSIRLGSVAAGLTKDVPGAVADDDLLLIQTFHRPLTPDELGAVESFYGNAFPGLATLYNDRSQSNSRISNKLTPEQNEVAIQPRVFLELGVKYR
ncbi:MAG: hypothetical protein AAB131_15200, partial [Actinomycetota bacterium]